MFGLGGDNMESAELLRKGQAIWSQLDDLAENDPEAYRNFIVSVQQQHAAEIVPPSSSFSAKRRPPPAPANRLVTPGLCITTTFASPPALRKSATSDAPPQPPARARLHINLAASERIPAPPAEDPTNIPLCVSELRLATGKAAETSCAWVIDAAVNTALVERCMRPGDDPSFRAELVELAVKSVAEVIGRLLGKERHIREGVYVEPYGWDTFGRPVGEGNFSPPSSKQLSGSTGLVDNSSFFTALHGNDSDSGEGLRELRMPSPSSKPLPSTSRPASESRHSRAPLIEELERIAPSVAMAPATLKAKRELPPSVDIRESDQTVTYALRLPNVSSQAQISVRVIDPARLIVETNDMEWSTQLREDVVADRHTAKFVKNSKTLKVSFALRSAQH